MIIGVPKEIKANENRVAITPAGVAELVKAGHRVLIQQGAGLGSGIDDAAYKAVGAGIIPSAAEVWGQAEMIIKVKEPLPSEYPMMRRGQILFTYLHLAADKELTEAVLKQGIVGIAYETVQMEDRSLPLLTPMSEVAGRMAVQLGAQFLQQNNSGRGVLLGGVPGVPPAEVVVVGGGMVGTNAAKIAMGMGAHVTILDNNVNRLRYLEDILHGNFTTVVSNHFTLERAAKYADLLVGAVLIPGAKAPKLVTDEMVSKMKPGSVLVDVAVDQGGCIETVDHPTTHADPIYVKHGVIHYAVANIPGAVPRTSTYALTNATIPYALQIANKGYRKAIEENPALAKGLNVINGKLVYKAVAEAHGMEYTPVEKAW